MVDLTFLEKFTKGDTDKMKRYIKMYLDVAPGTLHRMQAAIIAEDWDQLRIHAHSLKPQADYMGVPQLKSVLVKIENGVNEGKFINMPQLFEQALELHEQSEFILKSFLD